MKFHLSFLTFLATCLIPITTASARKPPLPNPDFTKGEEIPAGATHDWNLGATGARGWMHSEQFETSRARQVAITKIAKGSPADGVLKVGDVILGIGEKTFSYDPRTEFGKALTVAEAETGKLQLLRWRNGKTAAVTVTLPVLGSYSAAAPFNCPKSTRILEQGCEMLAKNINSPNYDPNPISRSLNALALLASGNPNYHEVIKKEATWAAGYSVDRFSTWYYGYVISFLAEYAVATGDESVMPGLRRLAMEAAEGQSIVGSWGHKFAGKDGRLVGYGMMNAPGVPLTISLVLAREAGVKDPKISLAIERSAKLLRFYIGKGAIPYGDHHPWIQMHEDNGKCGMGAVLFNLLHEEKGAKFFSRMSLASFGNERDTGHTGNFWNTTWAMPGVAQSGPNATGAWMKEFGAWYYDLARQCDGTFRHQGPPQARPDHTSGWDATGAYLLAYAMPLKKIMLTGKRPATTTQLSPEQAQEILDDGRGWSNTDRYSAYEKLTDDQLIERLGSWSPVVRERAAISLALRKGNEPIPRLIGMLKDPSLENRLGACQALAQYKNRAAAAVPALRETLKADMLWLRVKAADALAAIGEAAKPAVPELLEMLASKPGPDDPRAMEQRYLTFALFNKNGLLRGSLEGVDRPLLMKAVRAALHNQDGRARGTIVYVYNALPPDELKQLLPDIHRAVVKPAPSGIMFADQIRMAGLELLKKYQVAEGIDACMFYLAHQNHWGSENRTPLLLEVLRSYGAHAKRTIPELERLAADFADGEEGFPFDLSKRKAGYVRDTIKFLRETKESPDLIHID